MSKYIIEFTKTGTICFTSHLDLMRIMKRAFKRTGIALAYSQGFNPHPKMGFAQPLSLGYWGMEEYLEFETAEPFTPDELMQRLASGLPEGIELRRCLNADGLSKTLASHTVAAQYMIAVPVREMADGAAAEEAPAESVKEAATVTETAEAAGMPAAAAEDSKSPDGTVNRSAEGAQLQASPVDQAESVESAEPAKPDGTTEAVPQPGDPAVETDPAVDLKDPGSMWHSYMDMEEIQVWKRQKKKKEPKKIDIRPMIREIAFALVPEEGSAGEALPAFATLYIDATLDGGSGSNLSPELVITSALRRFGIETDRSEISVMRKKLIFDRPLDQLL